MNLNNLKAQTLFEPFLFASHASFISLITMFIAYSNWPDIAYWDFIIVVICTLLFAFFYMKKCQHKKTFNKTAMASLLTVLSTTLISALFIMLAAAIYRQNFHNLDKVYFITVCLIFMYSLPAGFFGFVTYMIICINLDI